MSAAATGLEEAIRCELPGGGRALFTTRAAGNLSTGAGDDHEHGLRRREQICEWLGVRWLCSSPQVHGTSVHVIERFAGTGGEPVAIDADGQATTLRGLGAMVMGADCLPVALGCDGAVATVHAGWRGLAAGVLEQGVRTLRDLVGGDTPGAGVKAPAARTADGIVAIVGPCAGVCCYEVGPEVLAALGVPGEARRRARGRHVDLRAIAHERLLAAGVAEVRDVDACTICDERFFSHRREGSHAGRQAGMAWLS
jgi:YfiH family protein